MLYRPLYPWYIEPPTNGSLTPLLMAYRPLPMVYRHPTHGIFTLLAMVYRPPTHGILTLYPWYIESPTHGISTPLPMVY